MSKLDATGSALVYSTYLGGSDEEIAFSTAVDGAGSAYVTGYTVSTNFPTTAGAAQTTHAGGELDAFVARSNSSCRYPRQRTIARTAAGRPLACSRTRATA